MRTKQMNRLLLSLLFLGSTAINADQAQQPSVCDRQEICKHIDDLKAKGSTQFNGQEYEVRDNPDNIAQMGQGMLIKRGDLSSFKPFFSEKVCRDSISQPRLSLRTKDDPGRFHNVGNTCGVIFHGHGPVNSIIVLTKKEQK